jgi:ATP-dependent Zn protease
MRGPVPGFEIARIAAVLLLLTFGLVGLLYAYRSQGPSTPQVDVSTALQDINAGRVRVVTIAGNKATLEFKDTTRGKEQTTIPEPDTILVRAVSAYNAANRSQAIELRFEPAGQTFGALGPILLSLLPVILIGGFFYYIVRSRRGS